METVFFAGTIIASSGAIFFLAKALFKQKKEFHALSLQLSRIIEQGRSMESIASIDLAPWIESCVKEPRHVWSRSFLTATYANMAKCLPALSILFAIETENKEEADFPRFVVGNTEPVLELILCELLSHNRKAMKNAPIELHRFGVNDHRTLTYEVISGIHLTIWIGSKRALAHDTWDQIVRYLAEVQRLFAILILKRRAKEASRRDDSQLMLQQVSHDIRSPLHNIKNSLVFAQESGGKDIDEYLDVALKNLDAVSELTESILDFSSVSSGVMQCSVEPIEIGPFLRDITQRYSTTASMKGLRLVYEDIPQGAILFDKRHLDRIVSNLLSNAIKYSSKGTIHIKTSLDEADTVSITVADEGIGLTSDQLQRLFTPFTRFQRHLAAGAGLGLSFAKQLAELNGGRMQVSSQFGVGSTFSIHAKRGIAVNDAQDVPLRSIVGVTVLLIDDDQDMRLSLERLLKAEGLNVLCAQNFIEAQSIAQMQSVDCIISDFETGGGSFEEFSNGAHFSSQIPPILLLSGANLTVVPGKVHSMVRKPVDSEKIVQWIKDVCGDFTTSEKALKINELAA